MKAVVVGMPASGRRAITAALVMICTAGLLAAATGQALAKNPASNKPTAAKKSKITPTTPITKGSTYLALGDSITFGYQESNVVPAPNYADASSFNGYPEVLGSELHLKVVNAACPGETSGSLIDATAQSNGCENTPGKGNVGYRTLYPLHTSYSGSQLAFAVGYLKKHQNVRLVSLLIGGNDYLYCVETTADRCGSLGEQTEVIATLAKNDQTILSTIRKKAHYNGQLVLVNQYSLSASLSQSTALLNQAIAGAAKPFHVEVADSYGEFQAAAAHSGGNPCTAGLLTQLGTPGNCGVHPSYAGQALLAQAVEKAVRLG